MDDAAETAKHMRVIQQALVSGIEVEDLLEAVIPRQPESGKSGGIAGWLRSIWHGERPHGGPEVVRRVADGLDVFAADLSHAGTVLDDPDLELVGVHCRELGPQLWASEIEVDHAYNEVRSALVELCRRRASLLTGRDLHTLR